MNSRKLKKTRIYKIVFRVMPIFILWSILIMLVNFVDFRLSCKPTCEYSSPAANLSLPWDGGWYQSVINAGYSYSGNNGVQSNVAFFPVAPLTYKAIRFLSMNNNAVYSSFSIFLNLILFFLSSVIALRIIEIILNTALSRKLSIILYTFILIIPSNFFIPTFYAESILIFTLLCALLFSIRRDYLLAAAFAGVSSGTKVIGLAGLVVVIFSIFIDKVEFINSNSKLNLFKLKFNFSYRDIFIIPILTFVSTLGIISYSFYLNWQFHEPLAFSIVQSAWGRNTDPSIINRLKFIYNNNFKRLNNPQNMPEANVDIGIENRFSPQKAKTIKTIYALYNTLNLMSLAIMSLIMGIIGIYKKVRFNNSELLKTSIILIPLWIVPISTGTLWSINRYLIVPAMLICPLIVYYVNNCTQFKNLGRLLLILGAIFLFSLQLLFFWGFLNWIFVG